MLHKDALKLLFPLDLGGEFERDIELEGKQLDLAQARVDDLLKEMFPDGAYELLCCWERVCGITPGADDTLQMRRDTVIRKLREIGRLDRKYFIDVAAAMGYTITIEELHPFMAGLSYAGDTLYVEESIFIWLVRIAGQSLYYFRAGQSSAGERLLWWPVQTVLENILNDLKPAHTYIIFDYS
ncbi:MAG: phage protein [Nitrospirae bacterium]|nr:MAG: phage protein [Nitrospirota bacterium]